MCIIQAVERAKDIIEGVDPEKVGFVVEVIEVEGSSKVSQLSIIM